MAGFGPHPVYSNLAREVTGRQADKQTGRQAGSHFQLPTHAPRKIKFCEPAFRSKESGHIHRRISCILLAPCMYTHPPNPTARDRAGLKCMRYLHKPHWSVMLRPSGRRARTVGNSRGQNNNTLRTHLLIQPPPAQVIARHHDSNDSIKHPPIKNKRRTAHACQSHGEAAVPTPRTQPTAQESDPAGPQASYPCAPARQENAQTTAAPLLANNISCLMN